MHKGAGRPRGRLPIAGETAVAVELGEGTFQHPAAWLHHEAALPRRASDDLQGDAKSLLGPRDNLALVACIAPDVGQAGRAGRCFLRGPFCTRN